ASHAIFRDHAAHHVLRLATEALNELACVRIGEHVERLLLQHNLLKSGEVARKRGGDFIGDNVKVGRHSFGHDPRARRAGDAMRRKIRKLRVALGMSVAAPGTYNFPPGSMKSACASTSHRTVRTGGTICTPLLFYRAIACSAANGAQQPPKARAVGDPIIRAAMQVPQSRRQLLQSGEASFAQLRNGLGSHAPLPFAHHLHQQRLSISGFACERDGVALEFPAAVAQAENLLAAGVGRLRLGKFRSTADSAPALNFNELVNQAKRRRVAGNYQRAADTEGIYRGATTE